MKNQRSLFRRSASEPMGNRVIGFRGNILIFIICTIALFAIILVSFGIEIFSHQQDFEVQFVFIAAIGVLIFSLLVYVFIQRIYIPIVKLEEAIKLLESVQAGSRLNMDPDVNIVRLSSSLNTMITQLKDSLDREYTAQILIKQAEIHALQSQINPHFLYNTLEAIRGQSLVNGMDEIADMIQALGAFYRYSISQKGSMVTLDEELQNVRDYFVIQQYRFDNKFNLKVILDDAGDLLDCKVPKLIIQPIVENAIYHGLETKVGKGSITIRAIATEKRLLISIADDGVGMEKQNLDDLNALLSRGDRIATESDSQHHTGIALTNVNQRIKLYFGESYGITVSSTKWLGTDVEIVLPMLKEDPHLMDGVLSTGAPNA